MLLGLDEPVWELGRNGSLLSSPPHLCLSCSSSGPPTTLREGPSPPPSAAESATPRPFAYYISGGRGDPDIIFRLSLAVYHPRNQYLLHIGADGSDDERRKLVGLVKSVAAIRYFANVDVMGKPDPLTYMGSTTIAATLHAVVVLLKVDGGWDWLITLRAADYPLFTQDGIRYFANADVMGKPDPLTYMESTIVAVTLHAVAILLKVDGGWDWLNTLSATDYSLLTQDETRVLVANACVFAWHMVFVLE